MTEQSPQFQPDSNPKASRAANKAYAKAQRPAWKKKRVILPLALLLIIGISLASSGGDTGTDGINTANTDANEPAAPAADKPAAEPAEPAIETSSKEMIALLEGNALKAKNTYDGKRVTVTGFVGSIDASGKYFSLDPEPDAFVLTGVQVQTGKEFQDQLANFDKNQPVTVTGKITNVGEVMGYTLEAETIK
jgi:hypothetical protein